MLRLGIFGKVFLYTLIFLLFTILVTAFVFEQQFRDFYNYIQIRQYTAAFEPLRLKLVKNNDTAEIVKAADDFHDKNQSFAFRIETKEGHLVYTTAIKQSNSSSAGIILVKKALPVPMPDPIGLDISIPEKSDTAAVYNNGSVVMNLENDLRLRTTNVASNEDLYQNFGEKVFVIVLMLLCFSVIGALMFARGITGPIRRLAEDTRKMASLEVVLHPVDRRDEVGQLAKDVHRMYEKLKVTISELETEIKREKEMEENQRYFFSAASHELKTPIAAASALLEGMIAGIGDYKNHTKYLRECLNMMNAQNRTITEILKIVSLSDERMVPSKENISLLSIINSLMPEYHPLAARKGQSIVVKVSETAFCRTDRLMISNVLSNILMNAIQNSPEGEEIRITCEEGQRRGTLRLSILNTNASIDDEVKGRLFEPFFRADKSRSRGEGRSGLGLTIVKKILDNLEIPFELDAYGSDVIFRMELPAAATD